MALQWKMVELNKEGVTSPSIPAHEAEASWAVNGKPGRYRVRDERRYNYADGPMGAPNGFYVVTRITPTSKGLGPVNQFKGYSFARHIASQDEAKAIAERDNESRRCATPGNGPA
jgi:hypothetical protein